MAERATTTAFSLTSAARFLGFALIATATLVAAMVLAGAARAGGAFDGSCRAGPQAARPTAMTTKASFIVPVLR